MKLLKPLNNMKNPLFVLILVSMALFSKAEMQGHIDYENFKARKVAFITTTLNLTPAEAEKFWPVYNEYDQKKFSLMQERKEIEAKMKQKADALTDQECTEISKKFASFKKIEGDLEMEYNEKFLKILSPQKVVKLSVAEMEFKGHLLREYKKDKDDRDDKR